jgi:hypothetical protein
MAPVAGSLTSEEARWAGSEQSSASLRNATTTVAPSRSRPEEGSASAIFIGSMPCEELARVGERPQAGEPRVAGEARGPPVAVALRGRVLITGRPAGAEALVHAGAGDCYLIVHRRLQLVESGGEILQGGGETLLLSGHRIAQARPRSSGSHRGGRARFGERVSACRLAGKVLDAAAWRQGARTPLERERAVARAPAVATFGVRR